MWLEQVFHTYSQVLLLAWEPQVEERRHLPPGVLCVVGRAVIGKEKVCLSVCICDHLIISLLPPNPFYRTWDTPKR